MPQNTPDLPSEEITPALRNALVELGAVIPTTPEEVQLTELDVAEDTEREELDAAFDRLKRQLAGDLPASAFLNVAQTNTVSEESGLARAARKGGELDAETLAKIEADLAKAKREVSD